MDIYLRVLGLEKFRPRTILVGGGTPTFLTPKQLKRFLEYFCKRMDLSKCRQFNYDVDPNTLCGPEGQERLKIMRDYGVNRLTIGVQSFNDHGLKLMNRHHDSKLALESIRNCQEFGYKLNIEFIFGFMGETMESWMEVLEMAVRTGVEEIQLYRLKVDAYGDHQGAVKQIKRAKADAVPTTEDGLMMKQLAIKLLDANGYHENLRRVFSKRKPDFSLYAHDQCCELYDQVGLGLTAFSSMRDRFGLNTQYFEEYYQAIDAGRLPLNRGYVRNRDEQIRWAIILPLKNREVRKKRFRERTGASIEEVFRPKIERLKAYGLATEDDKFLELTPLGAFFADEVCHQFQGPNFMAFPRSAYTDGPLNPYYDNEP
jgi:oxygen-independent coproporphyrinogen-3 oxidase